MTVSHYFCIVACLVGLGLTTVSEHVERVRIGYEIRKLERLHRRLKQERKARRLIWERHAAAESVGARAVDLGLIQQAELETLLAPTSGHKR